jgi:hypothetical protein
LEAGNKVFIDILEKHLPVFEKKVQIVLPKFKKMITTAPVSASAALTPDTASQPTMVPDSASQFIGVPTPQSQAPTTVAPTAPLQENKT